MDSAPSKKGWKKIAWSLVGVCAVGYYLVTWLNPVTGDSRDKARSIHCESNLKQLGLGLLQYAQDYDGKFPGGADHWAGALYTYEKSTDVYICPADPRDHPGVTDIVSYAMNANLRRSRISRLSTPADTVMLIDYDCVESVDVSKPERASQYTLGDTPNTAWGAVRLGTNAEIDQPLRHDPEVNALTCDGAVLSYRVGQISSGIDALSSAGKQDTRHAAGTGAIMTSPLEVTFSEK